MEEPLLWLWWLNVEPHFIAFLTGKMLRLRISLKIRRFGPGFQWTKCRSIFWKEDQRIFGQLVLSLSSARKYLTRKLAILKSGIFGIQIFLFGLVSLDLQTSFKIANAKGWRPNCWKPHRNWSFRSWEVWIYLWVTRFFHCCVFQPNRLHKGLSLPKVGFSSVMLSSVVAGRCCARCLRIQTVNNAHVLKSQFRVVWNVRRHSWIRSTNEGSLLFYVTLIDPQNRVLTVWYWKNICERDTVDYVKQGITKYNTITYNLNTGILMTGLYSGRHSPGGGCAGIHVNNRVPNCRYPSSSILRPGEPDRHPMLVPPAEAEDVRPAEVDRVLLQRGHPRLELPATLLTPVGRRLRVDHILSIQSQVCNFNSKD